MSSYDWIMYAFPGMNDTITEPYESSNEPINEREVQMEMHRTAMKGDFEAFLLSNKEG